MALHLGSRAATCERVAWHPTNTLFSKGTYVDPSNLLQLGFGFWSSKVLLSAVKLGVKEAATAAPSTNGLSLAIAYRTQLVPLSECHPRSL